MPSFTPSATDSAIEMLAEIFGPAFTNAVGTTNTAISGPSNMLAGAFSVFNSGVLFFGALVMMYVTVMGISNSANDGVALGKKWNTFMTPLRSIVAAAVLVPLSSGYAGIQMLIFYMVGASIAFASGMWASAVTYVYADDVTNQVVKSVVDDRGFETVATNAIRMQVCAHAVEKTVAATLPTFPVSMTLRNIVTKNDVTNGVEYVNEVSYAEANWAGSENLCGKLRLVSRYTATDSYSKAVNDTGKSLELALNDARLQATLALFNADGVRPISDQIIAAVEGGAAVSSSDVQSRVAALRSAVTAKLQESVRKNVAKSQQPLIDQYTSKGFMWAGSLHRELARVKDSVRLATKSNSDFAPGMFSFDSISSGEMLRAQNEILMPYVAVLSKAITLANLKGQGGASKTPTMPTFDSGFSKADFADGGGAIRGAASRFFKSWGDGLMSGVVYYLSDKDDKDVLWQVKNLGDYVAGTSEAGMLASAVAIGAMDGVKTAALAASAQPIVGAPMGLVAGAVAGVQTFFKELLEVVKPGAFALLYVGYFLSIFLPAVPFVVSTLAIVGWILATIESAIAGTLWAAAHTMPATNDSFAGSQGQGYLLLLSGFFRPALIVFGLIVSMTVLNPVTRFVNEAFMLYFRSAQADSLTGLLSAAGFLSLYAFVIFSVSMIIFTLPQTAPDRILRWIGGGVSDLGEGEAASKVQNGASGQAKAAVLASAAKGAKLREKRGDSKQSGKDGATVAATEKEAEPEGITGGNSFSNR